jgi:hypothetical protein
MQWNWQRPDWPRFIWQANRLQRAEALFLLGGGAFEGILKHLPPTDGDDLTVEALSTEALATSEIEGEILDRASLQSSVRTLLGLAADRRRVHPHPNLSGSAPRFRNYSHERDGRGEEFNDF